MPTRAQLSCTHIVRVDKARSQGHDVETANEMARVAHKAAGEAWDKEHRGSE